ncbi:MAG TPA: RnfABCDGE type electron transport complex subunit D [Terriglobales bacterium]|nr:RnfABCDGE type electron transport complex subunit D [Terriglobales bacterium]
MNLKPWRAWARTPKGLLLLLLTPLALWAALGPGWRLALPGLAAAALAAGAADLLFMRWMQRRWIFPDGALLTGLLVAMVLSEHEPWTYAAATALVAIVSKRLFRSRFANLFNPAAFGLVVTFYWLHTGQDWWGAMAQLPVWSLLPVVIVGLYIANRINKLPMVLSFLGLYFALATLATFWIAADVAELFRYPDAPAALFFAAFILTDPPTSPTRHRDQIVCGGLVALVAFVCFEWVGAAYYLLAGVLAGNVWEAARRWRVRSRPRPARDPLTPAAAAARR